jgi:hypothetical protein
MFRIGDLVRRHFYLPKEVGLVIGRPREGMLVVLFNSKFVEVCEAACDIVVAATSESTDLAVAHHLDAQIRRLL